jgi:hypothetical protein
MSNDTPTPSPQTRSGSGANWFRFWMRSLIAIIVFNIIAGIITWHYVFPHLHPAQ